MAMKAMKSATKTMATKAMKAIQAKTATKTRSTRTMKAKTAMKTMSTRAMKAKKAKTALKTMSKKAMQAMKAKKVGRKSLAPAGTKVKTTGGLKKQDDPFGPIDFALSIHEDREIAEQLKGTPQEIEEHMQSCEGAAYHAAILAGKEALTKGLTATIGAPPPQRRKYFSEMIVMRQ